MTLHSYRPCLAAAWIAAICLVAAVLPVNADTWFGASTTTNGWSDGANWSTSAPPGPTESVLFDGLSGFTNVQGAVNNVVDGNYTINDLSYSALVPKYNGTLIPSGQTLSINGPGLLNNLLVNTALGLNAANDQVYATITGGGTLTVSNSFGTMQVRQYGASGSHRATLDLSGLSTFSASISNLLEAVSPVTAEDRPVATILLAKTNFITTSTDVSRPGILMGRAAGTAGGGNAIMTLGAWNEINTEGLVIGGYRASGTASAMSFASGASGSFLKIRGSSGGTSRATLISLGDNTATESGYNGGVTSQSPSGTANLAGGSVDILVKDLVLGRNVNAASTGTGNTGVGTGTLSYEQGIIDVNNLYVAYKIGANFGSAVGTLNLNGTATMTVNTIVSMASFANATGNTQIPNATINVASGATLNVKGDILDTGIGISTINLNGGTINMQPAGDPTPGNITLDTLTGSGTITGGGTVAIGTNLVLGTAITPATMNLGGNLVLSNGLGLTFTLTNAATTGAGVNDYLNLTGDIKLNSNPLLLAPVAPLAVGTYRLIDYSGTNSGSFAFNNPTRYSLTLDQATAHQINLVNAGGTPLSLTWRGTNATWDVNTTFNWNNATEKYFQADSVTFDDTCLSTNVNLTAAIYPGAVTVNANTNYWFSGTGRVSGNTGITKSGAGALTVGTPNDFFGPVLVSGGTLRVTNSTALGSTNSGTTVANGATLDIFGTSLFSPGELITIAGNGVGGNGAIVNSGAAQNNGIRFLTLSDNASIRADNRFDVRGPGGNASFSGAVNLNGFTLTKQGAAQFSMADCVVTNAGSIEVAGGTLSLTRSLLDGPGYINVYSNVLLLENSTTGYIAKPIFVSGGKIQMIGNTSVLGSAITNNGVTFDVASGLTLTLTNVISGTGAVTKVTAGTLVLQAPELATGPVTVTGGRLTLSTNSSLPNASSIAVGSGAVLDVSALSGGLTLASGQTLSGSGSVVGDVTSGSGTGVNPGSSAGTLTFSNNLALNNSSDVFELGADPTQVGNNVNDLVSVTGDLGLGGLSQIKIVPLATLDGVTPYTLFRYGTLSGGAANLSVASDSRYNFVVVDPTTTPGTIQVQVSGSGASASLLWKGGNISNPNAWNTKVTSNWLNGAASDVFYLGDNVAFDDSAVTTLVSLSGTLQPASIAMSNSVNYSFGGSGAVQAGNFTNYGSGALTMTNSGANVLGNAILNSGTLTLGNANGNTFPNGATLANGAALNLRNLGANTFAQPLAINNGAVVFDQPIDATFAAQITDDGSALGSVEKRNANTLTLSGNNSGFNGSFLVSGGVLRAGNANALGTSFAGTTIASGATFDLNGFSLYNPGDLFTIAGAGLNNTGAVINTGAAQNNGIRALSLSANATIAAWGNRWDVRGPGGANSMSGSVSLNDFTLTKLGPTQLSFVDADVTSPGIIEIGGGILAMTRCNVDGAGWINVSNNVLLLENFSFGYFAKPLVANGGTIRCSGNDFAGLSSPITNLAGGVTFDTANLLTASGTIQGPGSLAKIGANTLILTATDSTWSTLTTIGAGTLQIGSGGADGSLPNLPMTNNGTLNMNSANSFVLSAPITGSGGITLNGNGTLVLPGSNSFGGVVSISGAQPPTAPRVGAIRIAHNNALGTAAGNTFIGGNTNGMARLELSNNITVADPILMECRQDASFNAPAIVNVSGNNTMTGDISGTTGGSEWNFESDSGKITLRGNFINTATSATRHLKLMGAASGEWSGTISNSANNSSITSVVKANSGTWTLSGTNQYSGATTIGEGTLALGATGSITNSATIDVQTNAVFDVSAVTGGFVLRSNQTLKGNGTVIGSVNASGTVSPGESIGKLTFANALVLGGTNIMEVSRTNPEITADLISIAQGLTYGGVLQINNIGDPLELGDTFNLYDAASFGGSFASVTPAPGAGLAWDLSKLTVDGTIKVVTAVNSNPTNITWSVSSGNLVLSWPADYIGWSLLVQTNHLSSGVSTNHADWGVVPGSTATNQVFIPLDSSKVTEFYRMALP